jgi:hypothetical protein
VVLPRAARSFSEVVLEVRVAASDLADALEGRLRERRTAEVRVHDHARRVERAAEAWSARVFELGTQARGEVTGFRAGADLLPRPFEHPARGVDCERVADRAGELVDGRKVPELHDRKDRRLR